MTLALLQTFHTYTCFQLPKLEDFLSTGGTVYLTEKDVTSFELGPPGSIDASYGWLQSTDQSSCKEGDLRVHFYFDTDTGGLSFGLQFVSNNINQIIYIILPLLYRLPQRFEVRTDVVQLWLCNVPMLVP